MLSIIFLEKDFICVFVFHLQASLSFRQLLNPSLLAHFTANSRFLWIIDAAERPEPGAHAIGASVLQIKREVKCREAN